MSTTARLSASVFVHPGLEIPGGISSLEKFRRWVRSEGFPEHGRIDWIGGRIEVDMSPEDLFTHGSPKAAISARLVAVFQPTRRGLVFIDSTRVSSPHANLSAEPDILVVLLSTLKEGAVRLVPKASQKRERFVEIEGGPDLVVECVSDSSEVKDKKRLRELYHRAGVREYWIVDARGGAVELQVLRHRRDGYVRSRQDPVGFIRSEVLGHAIRLTREVVEPGVVFFDLEVRPD